MNITKLTTTEAQLRSWREEGKSIQEIGILLGRSDEGVRHAISILGLGTLNRTQKESDVRAREMLTKLENGLSVRSLAREYRCSEQAIRSLLKRRGLPTTTVAAMREKIKRMETPE